MKKNVPDERKTKAILELICALDGRIVKVEDAGDGLVMIYANIAQYPGEEEYEDGELLDDEFDDDDESEDDEEDEFDADEDEFDEDDEDEDEFDDEDEEDEEDEDEEK